MTKGQGELRLVEYGEEVWEKLIKHFEAHDQYRWYSDDIKKEIKKLGATINYDWSKHGLWYRDEIIIELKARAALA